ncbi:hypothetical protein O1611_g10175 [Lasiodiplodia mahajangana]|uniref:Uncharacterized protein n=1 Tax=Lasiodiplodia mahajangana TaxID=1108764 RepID=A0ACC2J122_9PEZI|nr:hypothetical protein O1611_g10175 [Lasiodiplodia mahajangana]
MCKYPMKPSEHVDQVLQYSALVMALRHEYKSAGEYLGVRDNIGCPIERMAAVINGAAALGLVVYGA